MAEGFKTGYGLDLSAGRIVLARCARHGVPQALLAASADSEEAVRALQAAAAEVDKGVAALALCAPAAQTVVRRLRAPFASPRKAAKVWASLLDVDLPFPVESAACFYGAPRLDRGSTVAVAAAIRKSDLAALADACRASPPRPGGEPVRLPGAAALARRRAAEAEGVRLYPGIIEGLARRAATLGIAAPDPRG